MQVRCPRDGAEFNLVIQEIGNSRRVVCPKCLEAYYETELEGWRSRDGQTLIGEIITPREEAYVKLAGWDTEKNIEDEEEDAYTKYLFNALEGTAAILLYKKKHEVIRILARLLEDQAHGQTVDDTQAPLDDLVDLAVDTDEMFAEWWEEETSTVDETKL